MSWNLNRFINTLNFFGAVPIVNLFQSPNVSLPMNNHHMFDFRHPDPKYTQVWGCLDDVVMGGVSSSNFQITDNKAIFTGTVSTDNSGGFVSVRTRNFSPNLNFAEYVGISMTVKGDGNRYKFLLRDSNGWDSLAYSYEFDPPTAWGEVFMPFAEFSPVFRAKTVKDAPPLQLAHICSLQVMLSKFSVDGKLNPHFKAGTFCLEIEQIKGIR